MYLKSIEIQGFKSFAHKTVLNFNNGVTAIVGPNGSGKSNISDAVRWVLGEQKAKQLRGSAMQDVIFSGTEIRKPQGFAYVAITLDNSDGVLPVEYTEVTVSRRLYRSGESEYMINGQNVRLRDIQELFYDTGIGKEGYSIIGQGQIDAIINGRPEERRGLFDEAAGIVKFKRRKLTSLKKLESEQANLQRVTDIVDELSKRIKPLEKQSEAARHYLALRDEQKKLDLNLFVRELDIIFDAKGKAEDNLNISKAALEDAQNEHEELKAQFSGISDRIIELDGLIENARNDLGRAQLLKQNLEGQISVKNTEIKAEEDNVADFGERLKNAESEARENEKNSVEYIKALNELNNGLTAIKNDEESADIDATEIDTLIARTAAFKDELLRTFPSAAEACTENEQAADDFGQSDIDRETSKTEDDTDDNASYVMPDWLKNIKSQRSNLENIKDKENRTREWLKRTYDEYNALTLKLKDLQRAFADKQRLLADKNARYESLKNIAERYEGFGESIKALMREKSRIGGIRGVVADLIKTEKKYETAIEIALGGRIQNIVTDTEKSAKDSVAFLKRTKAGRATFLPLNALRYKEQPEYKSAMRESGAIGIASELVQADHEYDALVGYLLGSVLVVDNIDNALRIADKYRHMLRMVTLDGELLSPGGSISGGAYRNNSNLMGRSRELDELKSNTETAKAEFNAARDDIFAQEKLISEKNDEIERLKAELKNISDEKNELSYSIMTGIKLRCNELKQKTEFIEENINRICGQKQKADAERTSLNQKIIECRSRIEQALQEIKQRTADIENTSAVIASLDNDISSYGEEKDKLTGSRSDFDKKKAEYSESILQLQKDIIRLENAVQKEQDKLDSRSEYIWNEYELGPSAAKEYFDETLGAASVIKSRLDDIKKEIKNLGPVNVQAIEEYKEVAERYTFLSEQQQDLIKSEESIISIIEELDREMKKQFAEQFALIRERFSSVFKELFGGGIADLELVYDPEDNSKDELESGISIIVQPPGKKLQNIMQLSGGEKALTAIALLFAIQSLKPSPFCLLDEIEAALDDSNVIRFSGYLHKLTADTQFIVITHRRGTMESADRLYGVTMQEKGISKLVSVDLISDKLS